MLRISQGFCFQNLIIRDQYKHEKYSSYSDYVLLLCLWDMTRIFFGANIVLSGHPVLWLWL